MNEGEIAAGELVEAAEDAAKVFELAEQALDPGAFLVEVPVDGAVRSGCGGMTGTAPWAVTRSRMASLSSARSPSTAWTAIIATVPSKARAVGASPAWPAVSAKRKGLPRLSARPCSFVENPPRDRPRH